MAKDSKELAQKSAKVVQTLTGRNLPDDFFTPPAEAIHDPGLRTLYDVMVEEIKEEHSMTPGFGMLEAMLAERIVFIYIMIRDKERFPIGSENPEEAHGFAHERNYKEILSTWVNMLAQLQGARARATDLDALKEHVLTDVRNRLKSAVATLPKDMQAHVADSLQEAFSDAAY